MRCVLYAVLTGLTLIMIVLYCNLSYIYPTYPSEIYVGHVPDADAVIPNEELLHGKLHFMFMGSMAHMKYCKVQII